MIEIHNKSTYTRFYNRFSTDFLDAFYKYRLTGFDTNAALDLAKQKLREYLLFELIHHFKDRKTVMNAYTNVKKDSEIVKRAIKFHKGMKWL